MKTRGIGLCVAGTLLVAGVLTPAFADGGRERDAEVSLAPTLVTEGATPATEAEATFSLAESRTERQYGTGFSSLQYAPVPAFGIKLAVPVGVRDPKGSEPTVGGIGDLSVMAKYAPLMVPSRQFAASGGLKLTLPTGSERRDLGGVLSVAPFVALGRGLGPFSLQADVTYLRQLNRPRANEAEEAGQPRSRPDRSQEITANMAATYSPAEPVTLIVELNAVTVLRGDETLNERPQLYLTPGVAVEPAAGWNLRAGVQVPITSVRVFDYNVLVILTRGF